MSSDMAVIKLRTLFDDAIAQATGEPIQRRQAIRWREAVDAMFTVATDIDSPHAGVCGAALHNLAAAYDY